MEIWIILYFCKIICDEMKVMLFCRMVLMMMWKLTNATFASGINRIYL